MINNSIRESYCSFEVSKLLKEVSFDVYCQSWYTDDGKHYYNEDKEQTLGWNNRRLPKGEYSRPTHSVAIEWIRVNFGYYCFSDPVFDFSAWTPRIVSNKKYGDFYKGIYEFTTSQEATEAALLYTLQKLIQ